MKIKGRITILIDRDQTRISIEDDQASIILAEIVIDPMTLNTILSRQAYVPCEVEVGDLSKIGKKHENKEFEFELPKEFWDFNRDHKKLAEYANTLLEDGWVADPYFDRQGSFFSKDGKHYAKCVIRRWV